MARCITNIAQVETPWYLATADGNRDVQPKGTKVRTLPKDHPALAGLEVLLLRDLVLCSLRETTLQLTPKEQP